MPEPKGGKSKVSRRAFGRQAALSAAAAAALSTRLLGKEQSVSQPSPPQNDPSPASQAEADAMFAAMVRQHGDKLSDAQKIDLRRLVNEAQKPLQAMRAFPLDNADQPGNVLKLYPDPQTETPAKPTRA